MKIVHLTVCRKLSRGQEKQLSFEYQASAKLNDIQWITLAYHAGPVTGPFVRNIPFPFRSLLMRMLYGWLIALRLSKTHDVVMIRHMSFNPFCFVFSPLIRNYVSVHHSKEVEEMKIIRSNWKGKVASLVERVCGRVSVRNAKIVLGVTREIAEYERDTRSPGKPIGLYPNGVDSDQIVILDDFRAPDRVNIAFISGTFSAWHGLDKLINSVDSYEQQEGQIPITIHLIGRLSDSQASEIKSTEKRQRIFRSYGVLVEAEYRQIMSMCDVGIGSLAMERENLTEGSTLKVREMLAMGLPVFSGHFDSALDEKKAWVKIVKNITLQELLDFAGSLKSISREQVRRESLHRIEKLNLMKDASLLIRRHFGV